jgi:hypothetical protein
MNKGRQRVPEISFSVEPVDYTCDRCGFGYRAGFIWIVDGRWAYFCRVCQSEMDQATAGWDDSARDRYVRTLMKQLGLLHRGDRDTRIDTKSAAGLLGLHQ